MIQFGLDYDDTYTEDPVFFDELIKLIKKHGHFVMFVTARHPHDKIHHPEVEVIYTCGKKKREVCSNHGYEVDIWIEDMPWLVQ